MKQTTHAKLGLRLIALALGSLAPIPALRAETATWIGNGSTSNWGQAVNSELNWVGDAIPAFGDTLDVVFHAEGAVRLDNFVAGGSTVGTPGNWDPTYGRRVRTLTFNGNADADIIIHTSQTIAAGGSHRPLQFDTDAVGPEAFAELVVVGDAEANIIIGGINRGFIYLRDPLKITHNGSGTLEIRRPIIESGGVFGITKQGSGTVIFSSTNGYTGDTTVTAGTLRLTNASLADTAAVRLDGEPVLDLTHGLSDTVGAIYFDGVAQATGTWGSTESGADHIDDDRFLGSGRLQVLTPFESWAASQITAINPGATVGFDDDPDGDGIANGLEWILGGNPLAQDAAGLVTQQGDAATGLTLEFTRAAESLAGTTLAVRWDTALDGTWPGQVVIGAATSGPDVNGVTVTIDDTGDPHLVTVLIPATNAPAGRIFARLEATLNP
jgi:autotransporter-associated beta strand protein